MRLTGHCNTVTIATQSFLCCRDWLAGSLHVSQCSVGLVLYPTQFCWAGSLCLTPDTKCILSVLLGWLCIAHSLLGWLSILHSVLLGWFCIPHIVLLGWLCISHIILLGWLSISHSVLLGWLSVSCSVLLGWLSVSHCPEATLYG